MKIDVLYRDDDVLVIDKPNGIAVHAAPGCAVHLTPYLPELAFGLPELPFPAHRLDKDTSGCLVLGRHAAARRWIGIQFRDGRVEKSYRAILTARPPSPTGRCDLALKKRVEPRPQIMLPDPDGLPASTLWQTIATGPDWTEVLLTPLTGRFHQLRAHMAALGCPIMGDPFYAPGTPGRLRLHAENLSFCPAHDKPVLKVSSPIPLGFRPDRITD